MINFFVKTWLYCIVLCIVGMWVSLIGMNQDSPIILALLSLPFFGLFVGGILALGIFGEVRSIARSITGFFFGG